MAEKEDVVQKQQEEQEEQEQQQEEEVTVGEGTAGGVGTGRQSGHGPGSGHRSLALVDHREGSGDERSEPELPGRGPTSARADRSKIDRPNPEVVPQAKRRRFSAKYKLEILNQADACTQPGELGALLRREGLYYSHVTNWRRQREQGTLAGLAPKKRGRKPDPDRELRQRNAQLEKENRRLADKLEKAELIIEVQKKVARLLGLEQQEDKGGKN